MCTLKSVCVYKVYSLSKVNRNPICMTLCFVSFAAVSVGQLLIALHSGSQIFPLFLPLPPDCLSDVSLPTLKADRWDLEPIGCWGEFPLFLITWRSTKILKCLGCQEFAQSSFLQCVSPLSWCWLQYCGLHILIVMWLEMIKILDTKQRWDMTWEQLSHTYLYI